MDPRIAEIEKGFMRKDLPAFAPGDTVRVRVRVREGDKERIQPFEGLCIGRRGSGVNATFTLRRVSGGVGVERIFPLHSPWIAGLEIVRRGDVRRAKLYYLRARRGKRARVRERKWWLDTAAYGEDAMYWDADAETMEDLVEQVDEAEPEAGDVPVEASDAAIPERPEETVAEAEPAIEDAVEPIDEIDEEAAKTAEAATE